MARPTERNPPGDRLQESKPPAAGCSTSRTSEIREEEPVMLSIVEGAPRELVAAEKIFDIKSLPSWLYAKERQSAKSYFEDPGTPRIERNWKEEAGVCPQSYSKRGQKRARAEKTACNFLLIKLQISKELKLLLSPTHSLGSEWRAINNMSDSAKLFPQRKYALVTNRETISVLLIRLLIGLNAHTKIKILDLLEILAEVYKSKVLIANLGGFRILTKSMLLGETTLEIKKKTIRLLSSLCEASENIGCFLKDSVAEAVLQELGICGTQIAEEFYMLVSTARSETMLGRFMSALHLLRKGPQASAVHHTTLSIIQNALQELRGEAYGDGRGWDW